MPHNKSDEAGLYLVATPIGHAQDITLRALDVLRRAALVLCEDTRHTRKLLHIHGCMRGSLVAWHEHAPPQVAEQALARVEQGEMVALVSDAGMPLISDPGYEVVRQAHARGLSVRAVPGASSVLAAVQVSGISPAQFAFCGFLPTRQSARRAALMRADVWQETLVFFEAARRLPAALEDMAHTLGEREAAVVRELTKVHESVERGSLAALAVRYGEKGAPRGEVVVVVGPRAPVAIDQALVDQLLAPAMVGMGVREAATLVAKQLGMGRSKVYARALALQKK